MNQLKIEHIDQTIRFTLIPKKVNIFIKAILFIIAIATITIPFKVLFSTSFSKTAIVGAILCGFISIFILRMFLWNAFGKEVFEIGERKIFHYIDYQFFKDKLLMTEDMTKIQFGYTNEINPSSKVESKLLDIEEKNKEEEYLFIISNHEGELAKANVKLSFSKVQQMIKVIEADRLEL